MQLAPQTETLAKRGRAHTRLRGMLDRRSMILHPRERDVIVDAADALLFDESDGWEKRDRARDVLAELVASGRWLAQPADDALDALDACAGPELATR